MANRSFLELRLGLLGLLLLVFSCQEESPDPTCSPYTPPIYPDQYDFPLRPGMPEWAALQTGEDMYKVTQLPDSVLQEISSEGLLETCLDYPLLYNVFAYTSLQFGFTRVLSRFNGFEELGSRPDASPLLLNRYQEMDVTCFQNMSEVEQGGYTFTFTFVEMILAQEEYLSKLSPDQRQILMLDALNKYNQKQENFDIYGIFGLKTTVFLMARIMQLDHFQPFLTAVSQDEYLDVFLKDVELQGRFETLDIVVDYAKNFK